MAEREFWNYTAARVDPDTEVLLAAVEYGFKLPIASETRSRIYLLERKSADVVYGSSEAAAARDPTAKLAAFDPARN